MEYNLFCDESCHLPQDHQSKMVIGGIWCPKDRLYKINKEIREIKHKYNVFSELKWVKVSNAKLQLYLELIDYFFSNADLHFRGLIVANKDAIRHELFNQTHDDWYYKMYFDLIKIILNPVDKYNIYLDIKDTKSKPKVKMLHHVLNNCYYDYDRNIINRIQVVQSHEIELMQLTDIFIGALGYLHREYSTSNSKLKIIQMIREKSKYSLAISTLVAEKKFNLFILKLQNYN